MLPGRLRSPLQFFSSILRRPKRWSIDSDFWEVFKFRATSKIEFPKAFQLKNARWETLKPKRRSIDSAKIVQISHRLQEFWKVFKFRDTSEIEFRKIFQLKNARWETLKAVAIFQINHSETEETLD
ncbi:unnamed protein product [Malus baccata var. baccata]